MPVKAARNNMSLVENWNGRKDIFVNQRIVDSSNVEWVAWPVTGEHIMFVKFWNGVIYSYIGVSRQKAVAAARAKSTGSYINKKIKPHYQVVKLAG